jgi:meso-butanediol dehydrogenase / (S,S)-butanediol dehydrogenase / diacetyl reductase
MDSSRILSDKVAIVTGGSNGIGRATSELFVKEGAYVIIFDTDKKTSMELVEFLREKGGKADYYSVNVSQNNDVKRNVDRVFEKTGRIDILVNNAGIYTRGNVIDTSVETWDTIMSVNLKGVFLCCKHVIPYMEKNRCGSIINMSSSVGWHDAASNIVAYAASKGGVTLLSKAMSIDHVSDNIRVNIVCPGPTDTPLIRNSRTREELDAFRATLPMNRFGKPEEIAEVILFLASERSSYVTGATIAVDGGQTAEIS